MSISIKEIAEIINAEIENKKDFEINDIKKIDEAGKSDITFLHNEKYYSHIKTTKAKIIIVPKDFTTSKDITLLKVDDPYKAFLKILRTFFIVGIWQWELGKSYLWTILRY